MWKDQKIYVVIITTTLIFAQLVSVQQNKEVVCKQISEVLMSWTGIDWNLALIK